MTLPGQIGHTNRRGTIVRRIAGAPLDKPVLGPAKRERPTERQRGPDASEATDPEFDADADALEQFDREN